MDPELKQLDLFVQGLQDAPAVQEKKPAAQAKEPEIPARTELLPIPCARCGQWLCDALPGAKAYCPRCRVWSSAK